MRIPVKNITNGEVDAEGKPILRMSIHIGEGNAILNGKKYPIELLADGEGGVTFVFLEGRDLSGKREVFRVESGSVVPRLLLRPGEDPPDDDELIERAISGLNDLVEISKILGLKDNEGVIDGTLRLVGERAELREQVAELLPEADAKQHFATRALRAEKRINMAREALEAIANTPWGGAPRDLLKELQAVSEALNGPMVLGQPEPSSSNNEPAGGWNMITWIRFLKGPAHAFPCDEYGNHENTSLCGRSVPLPRDDVRLLSNWRQRCSKCKRKAERMGTEEWETKEEREAAEAARRVRWHDEAGNVGLKSGEETTIEDLVIERDRLRGTLEKRTRSAEGSAMELLEIVDIFDPSGHGNVEDLVEVVRAAVAERDRLRSELESLRTTAARSQGEES